MIHLPNKQEISYLLGTNKITINCVEPYNSLSIEFLDKFSKILLANKSLKKYSDLMTLAFWCRRKNIEALKFKYNIENNRLGLGLVFHITPSNIPINFMISYIYGLLSGNSNIVRIPSKDFEQTSIIISTIKNIFSNEKYKKIEESTQFISYERDDETTSEFSKIAQGRVIWGGDLTINNIKKLPSPAKSIDITFSDRYSMAILNSNEILKLDKNSLSKLALDFYNDTLLMDQNACSSPHLILWKGQNQKKAKEAFWNEFVNIVNEKYELSDFIGIDKFTKFCQKAIEKKGNLKINKYQNIIYCVQLDHIDKDIVNLRGIGGYFYEYSIENFDEITPTITNKIQTLCYFGENSKNLSNYVLKNHLQGIDRIVPVGRALDIGLIWDGYDIVRTLSRMIDII